MMPYLEAVNLLASYGIELPPANLVDTPGAAVEAAEQLGYPVVVKAISPDLSHKSDQGLLRLDLASPESVRLAASELLSAREWTATPSLASGNEQRPQHLEGLLVQKMLPAGVEMIVGVHNDPQFGLLIALGSGGIWVELLDDLQFRLPPLNQRQAMTLIQETRSWTLLQGFRHFAPADISALAQLLVNVSRLTMSESARIVGLDLNPVIVLPEGQGVGIVDLRLELGGPSS
ncbi:MAG: acetate--CoA ligase family protein, partial [Candidatus Promineifilaceae bacterium]|nr:acetate--CoA ligase family protein [Candidatus Promineifilaceae bacterium]